MAPSDGIEGGVLAGVEGGVSGGVALSGFPVRPGQSVIVFERNGVRYVVDDPVLVERAKRLQPGGNGALLRAKLEAAKELEVDRQLGQGAAELKEQMAAELARASQEQASLSSEEIAKRMGELKSHLAALNNEMSQMRRDWTVQDLEQVQRQLAELQSSLGHYDQGLAASQAEAMARDLAHSKELQSGGQLLKQNAEALREAMSLAADQKQKAAADEQMQKLLDDALKNGKAKRR